MSLEVNAFSFKAMLQNYQKAAGTYWESILATPRMILQFWIFLYKSFLALFNYHILTMPAQPLNNEVVLILGSDSLLGKAFASQTVKMHGSVVCIDASKEKGDAFVKSLNDAARDTKAYFYECDLIKTENLTNIIETVTKEVGDVSILVNCSTKNIVESYFSAFKNLVPIMKGNGRGKGRFVFIRTLDAETRNAVQSLYESVDKDLKTLKKDDMFASLVHVYPKISEGEEKNKVFGFIKHDDAAKLILEGVSKNQRDIYLPSYMAFYTWWFKFMPSSLANMWEGFFFGDK